MTSRQEVAEKLRESGKWLDRWDTATIREAFYLIEQNINAPQGREFVPFFDHLADLIDPTCHLALDEELSQELQGEMFRCGKCDAAFPRINGEYRYCPNCGARVVRDEA